MNALVLALVQIDPAAGIDMTWNLLVMTGVVGLAVTAIMQGLKKGLTFVDGLHPALKQLIVVVLAWGIALGGKFLGITLPADIAQFGAVEIQAIMASAFSMTAHAVLKATGVIKPKEEVTPPPPL
jgi:hypothetical protein